MTSYANLNAPIRVGEAAKAAAGGAAGAAATETAVRGLRSLARGVRGGGLGAGVNALGRRVIAPLAIVDTASRVFNPDDNILTAIQGLARSIERATGTGARPERQGPPVPAGLRSPVGNLSPADRQINQYPEGVPSGPAPVVTPPAVLGGSNVPIRTGAPNRAVELARQQAEQQARLEGQYRSPGFWKSDDGAAMMALANQAAAPKERSLADYYSAQRAVGIGAQDEIVAGLTQGLGEQEAKAMKAWAGENPALALREYNKRFPAGEPTMGPTPPADADLATAAGQAVRENMRRLAENQRWNPAGAKFVDRSGLSESAAPNFIPAPTTQAVAAADGLTAFSGPVAQPSMNFEQAAKLPLAPPPGGPLAFDASAITPLTQSLDTSMFTNEHAAEFLKPWLARARQ